MGNTDVFLCCFDWNNQSFVVAVGRFLACAMEVAAFPSTALTQISLFASPPVALFLCSHRFLGNFLGSVLFPSKAACGLSSRETPPQNEGSTLTLACG